MYIFSQNKVYQCLFSSSKSAPKPLTIDERAAIRHAARTPEQAQAIQKAWDASRKEAHRQAILTAAIARHAERTQKQIETIKEAWSNRPQSLNSVVKALENAGVEYNEVKQLTKELTEEEIISRIGGGDETSGSCASLAYTWVANRAKLDVLDFRGGKSLDFFSQKSNDQIICKKVGGIYENNISGIELMRKTEIGKEYFVGIGRHAAIVRQVEKGKYEYLELQSPYSNGWKKLNSGTFADRFDAKGRCYSGRLIEISLLQKNVGFKKMMGYINTLKEKQNKSTRGSIK